MQVSMTVNGSIHALAVEPRMTLLDALRDELGLNGPKRPSTCAVQAPHSPRSHDWCD
jgi:aerobic-type carbon monoxide dehydrogenase small subunit (CoxS/CutS family)